MRWTSNFPEILKRKVEENQKWKKIFIQTQNLKKIKKKEGMLNFDKFIKETTSKYDPTY